MFCLVFFLGFGKKGENKICFAFADYLELYFDLMPGEITDSVIENIIISRGFDNKKLYPDFTPDMLTEWDITWYRNFFSATHVFGPPPIPQKYIDGRERAKWKRARNIINELGDCIIIKRTAETPVIIRDLSLMNLFLSNESIFNGNRQIAVQKTLRTDPLNEGVNTIFRHEPETEEERKQMEIEKNMTKEEIVKYRETLEAARIEEKRKKQKAFSSVVSELLLTPDEPQE